MKKLILSFPLLTLTISVAFAQAPQGKSGNNESGKTTSPFLGKPGINKLYFPDFRIKPEDKIKFMALGNNATIHWDNPAATNRLLWYMANQGKMETVIYSRKELVDQEELDRQNFLHAGLSDKALLP